MSRKLILIDGNSLVYRAYYALPTTLALSTGLVTNAVYGFTSMLIRLLIDEQPDVVAVAFDSKGPTFRHEAYELYKAHRKPAPDDLHPQFPLVKEVLDALAIPIFEAPGYEGDDILATLAVAGRSAGDEVLVVTGDRDALQLITDDKVRVMTTRKGITDIVIYDSEKVVERYGITPEQMPDYLALKGDASDNIPGVPGIGDKTAAKLIQEYGTLESVYDHVEDISREKLRQALKDNKDQAELSKKLAILDTKVPIEAGLEDVSLGQWDEEKIRQVFSRFEFRTLLERFESKLSSQSIQASERFLVEKVDVDPTGILPWLKAHEDIAEIGLEVLLDDDEQSIGWAVSWIEKGKFKAFAIDTGELDETQGSRFHAWLKSPSRTISTYDLKEKIKSTLANGRSFEGVFFDPLLAAYLLNPSDIGYELKHLIRHYNSCDLVLEGSLTQTAEVKAAAALALMKPLEQALEKEGLDDIFNNIEVPLAKVLARMEVCGVGIDKKILSVLAREMKVDMDRLTSQIYKLAGEEFNINSPKQVSEVLFEKLGLTPGRRTKAKGAYVTDAAVLAKLSEEHEIVPLIIEYREKAKLKSTYIDALPKLVNSATGRLHTSFNQTVTATGRLSSSNPNLQNIPVRTELGRRIRKAFVPAHRDEKLLVADYSQIELRLLAHLSGDKALKQAFKDKVDIHTATAAEVFGVSPKDVSSQLRRHAKAVNFGIIYGISPFGLAEQLGISSDEAKEYIELYLGRYPGVRKYLEKTVANAYKFGYVTTLTGRKRYVTELKSTQFNQRSFGERVATNAPLQGGAADIIKVAMINIDSYLVSAGLQTRMVLQVHDELVFEVPPMEESVVTPKIESLMKNAFSLSVPLEVNISFGKNWDEAK